MDHILCLIFRFFTSQTSKPNLLRPRLGYLVAPLIVGPARLTSIALESQAQEYEPARNHITLPELKPYPSLSFLCQYNMMAYLSKTNLRNVRSLELQTIASKGVTTLYESSQGPLNNWIFFFPAAEKT